jgi:hypothetical protein
MGKHFIQVFPCTTQIALFWPKLLPALFLKKPWYPCPFEILEETLIFVESEGFCANEIQTYDFNRIKLLTCFCSHPFTRKFANIALLPLDGILVHRRLPPQLLLVLIYIPGLRETSRVIKCLAQGHRMWPGQDSNPEPTLCHYTTALPSVVKIKWTCQFTVCAFMMHWNWTSKRSYFLSLQLSLKSRTRDVYSFVQEAYETILHNN